MRRAAKVDGNQAEIVEALRGIDGCIVQLLSAVGQGVPDLLVGYRGFNFLFECKDETQPNHRHELTPDQQEWHAKWTGQVQKVFTVSEIISTMTGWAPNPVSADLAQVGGPSPTDTGRA